MSSLIVEFMDREYLDWNVWVFLYEGCGGLFCPEVGCMGDEIWSLHEKISNFLSLQVSFFGQGNILIVSVPNSSSI